LWLKGKNGAMSAWNSPGAAVLLAVTVVLGASDAGTRRRSRTYGAPRRRSSPPFPRTTTTGRVPTRLRAAGSVNVVRSFLRNSGLTLFFLLIVVLALAGQAISGV
jgi:hypothetical protein